MLSCGMNSQKYGYAGSRHMNGRDSNFVNVLIGFIPSKL